MSRELVGKLFMVTVLLGALGVLVKISMDAQEKEPAAAGGTSDGQQEGDGSGDLDDETKREIRGIIRQAIYAHRQLDYETAERLLKEASERYPEVAAVWLNLGICYRSLGKLDEADGAFKKVLALNAEDWDAIAERATVLLMRDQVGEAIQMLETIPANMGQVNERLRADELWVKVRSDARLQPLLVKHGVIADGDSSVQQIESVLKQRRETERSRTATPADDARAPKR